MNVFVLATLGLADVHDPGCSAADPSCCDLTATPAVLNGCYNLDTLNSSCSPRDPMFWRLHKALDDVVRAWQDSKAVDVIIAIDRSGSMSSLDASGKTKLEAALDAAENFADLLDHNRPDGQQNRIALLSYSNNSTLHLPLTVADANLLAPGGQFLTALNEIRTQGPGGCTSIGSSLNQALTELCPPSGNCQLFDAPGDNDRKGILSLTDGSENQPPCLNSVGASGGGCGSQCFGPPFTYDNLAFSQVVSVGFGNTGLLNGDLLTLLAERQGGIYLQNPNAPGDDLKNFFIKAFGQLTDDFILLDPKGVLSKSTAASPVVEYKTCGDAKLTFDTGWDQEVKPGELQLLVNTPRGDLVRAASPSVQSARKRLWAYDRVQLPYRGETRGTWQAQLIRPHHLYVNGFAPDAFAVPEQGVALVRRQIQRLCPEGCKNVLHYEQGRSGAESVYLSALKQELNSGLLGAIIEEKNPDVLVDRLLNQRWDLIVYARMGDDQREPYDATLARLLCRGAQKAIITDTRKSANGNVLKCARVRHDGNYNWTELTGDSNLFDGSVQFKNPGYSIATYGLSSAQSVQAKAGSSAGIVARITEGSEQNWFVNVLGQGLSRVQPVRMRPSWTTAEPLLVSARIPPSYHLAGGYDHIDARVEVEYPTIGLGTLLAKRGLPDEDKFRGEFLDRRAAALAQLNVPTRKATLPLFDDGTHGDVTMGNHYWTTELKGLGQVDGMYRFRFIFDLTKDGCTTRREVTQSMFVDTAVDEDSSDIVVGRGRLLDNGCRRLPVRITPRDQYGNLWGPGRLGTIACSSKDQCRVVQNDTKDDGKSTYHFIIDVRPDIGGVRLHAFNTALDLATGCRGCATLLILKTEPKQTEEHTTIKAELRLTNPVSAAAREGELVYLTISNARVIGVPDRVRVPPGRDRATFPVQVLHVSGDPEMVRISAAHGNERRSDTVLVTPAKHDPASKPVLLEPEYLMRMRPQ